MCSININIYNEQNNEVDLDIEKDELDESLNIVNIINKYSLNGVHTNNWPKVTNYVIIQNIIYNLKYIESYLSCDRKFKDSVTLTKLMSELMLLFKINLPDTNEFRSNINSIRILLYYFKI